VLPSLGKIEQVQNIVIVCHSQRLSPLTGIFPLSKIIFGGRKMDKKSIKEKLAELIEVKKLIALFLTLIFCVLAFQNEVNTYFMSIYTMIIGFYFGQSTMKANNNNK
jgi:hypothetical protein